MSTNNAVLTLQDRTAAALPHPVLPLIDFHDDRARRIAARSGICGLGETFEAGLWDTEDLAVLMDRLFTSPPLPLALRAQCRRIFTLLDHALLNRQIGKRAFRIGREHYDLGNDLFRCMLDQSMTYTSGYWTNARSLEEAQQAKLELICRKLGLKPGDHVLDIGCGWGNFAHFAATEYGARVTGITVSEKQVDLARERCEGLDVEIRLQDYRDLNEQFDHIVSIEMIEAVGRKNIGSYFRTIDRCLKRGGLCVVQAISGETFSRTSDRRIDQFMLWLVKYIFPDGYLPRSDELLPPPATDLRIEDRQRFYDDYNRTLLAWEHRFSSNWAEIAHLYSERFRRRWIFYLHGCAAAFRARLVDVYQIVYSKGGTAIRYERSR